MIVSNITSDKYPIKSKPGAFFTVADSLYNYAQTMSDVLPNEQGKSGADHFVSTIRAIDKLKKDLDAGNVGADDALHIVESSPPLRRWFSMIVTVMIYGCNNVDDKGNISVVSMNADSYVKTYLKLWADKLKAAGAKNDEVNGNIKVYDDNGGSTENIFNVYYFDEVEANNLSGLQISDTESTSLAGCFSQKYFIIPARYISLAEKEKTPWKLFYLKLVCPDSNLFTELFVNTTYLQRALMMLSADSITSGPLTIVKEIITAYCDVKTDNNNSLSSGSLTCELEINGMKLFKSTGAVIERLFLDKISFVYSEDNFAALYPFNQKTAAAIESGICHINELKMQVTAASSLNEKIQEIKCVKITCEVVYDIKIGGDSLSLRYKEKKHYSQNDISYVYNLPSFFMVPDVALENEHRVKEHTLIARKEATLSSLIGLNTAKYHAVSVSKIASLNSFGGNDYMYRHMSEVKHLMDVWSSDNSFLGFVLNLRQRNKSELPALLEPQISVNISTKSSDNCQQYKDQTMIAYFQIDADKISVAYKINGATDILSKKVTGGTPYVRKLLSAFAKRSYETIIDDRYESYETMPSYAAYMQPIGEGAYTVVSANRPFEGAFVPFYDDPVKLKKEGLFLTDVNGTVVDNHVIINQLCQMAACHALNIGVQKLIIIPSIPESVTASNYEGMWQTAISSANARFGIPTESLFEFKNQHLLNESVIDAEYALNISQQVTDVLLISVNIGVENTTFTALSVDAKSKNIVARSSVNIGWRDLIWVALLQNYSPYSDYVDNTIGQSIQDHNTFVSRDVYRIFNALDKEPDIAACPFASALKNSLRKGFLLMTALAYEFSKHGEAMVGNTALVKSYVFGGAGVKYYLDNDTELKNMVKNLLGGNLVKNAVRFADVYFSSVDYRCEYLSRLNVMNNYIVTAAGNWQLLNVAGPVVMKNYNQGQMSGYSQKYVDMLRSVGISMTITEQRRLNPKIVRAMNYYNNANQNIMSGDKIYSDMADCVAYAHLALSAYKT